MKTIIVLLIIFSDQNIAYVQEFDCSNMKLSIVTAESGLNLRDGPSLESKKILTISKNEKVLTCYANIGPEILIDGVSGRWIRSKFKHYEGYLFSGYLSIKKCEDEEGIRVVIPNDGLVDNFPLTIFCTPYQGVYEQEMNPGLMQKFDVRPIEIVDTTINYRMVNLGELEEGKKKPLFLISGMNIKDKQIEGRLINKMYFPFEGETIWMDHRNKNERSIKYMVFANGTGVRSKDPNSEAMFGSIENYELWIRKYQQGKPPKDLLVYKADLHHFIGGGYEGGAWLYWIGDLNGDGIPDIIIGTSNHYASKKYKLLLSNPTHEEELYQIITVGEGSTC